LFHTLPIPERSVWISNKTAQQSVPLGGYNHKVFIRMIYALVHYPNIDIQKINQFRKKYDPQIDLIQPHITLMFPVPESIGESFLANHIENALSNWRAFPIHLQGILKS
jgi:hypothetical protein